MEKRLLLTLGIAGLIMATFLFVARIRIEPLPSGIHTLFKMAGEDPTNTRLAQVADENVEAIWDLRHQRNRAELTAIFGFAAFGLATLLLASRLPKYEPATGTSETK